jgi:hypothetical protein
MSISVDVSDILFEFGTIYNKNAGIFESISDVIRHIMGENGAIGIRDVAEKRFNEDPKCFFFEEVFATGIGCD